MHPGIQSSYQIILLHKTIDLKKKNLYSNTDYRHLLGTGHSSPTVETASREIL